MSNPDYPGGAKVDPSEDTIDEGQGTEQQSAQAAETEGDQPAPLQVDPSEGPTE